MRASTLAACALLLGPAAARAHHGVAVVSVAGPEGPGAAIETTSPLPLPVGRFFTMVKTELASFQQFAFAQPANKSWSSFNMLAVGYGVTPWLTAYVFQPLNAKAQDGVGTNRGLGDTNVMLSLGMKYDEGLRLVPEKESLDELLDWHFSVWTSSTVPVAPTTHRDANGAFFAPDMQTGFGAPAPAIGVAVLKQLSDRLTWIADASYQHFFAHTYPFTRYQFGGETRLDAAAVYKAYGSGAFRADVTAELNRLHLQRDRERSEAGELAPLRASGGAILYGGAGVRMSYGAVSLGVGVKRAALKDLNEAAAQQGSEGLERFRAGISLSWSKAL